MGVLFGHPTGNPNSHHAALAHWESGHLDAFCVPWMPTSSELSVLQKIPGLGAWAGRLERRSFPPLAGALRIEDKWGEWKRMAKRVLLNGLVSSERLAYEANDWLMDTMAGETNRPSVTTVHSYEDCSLRQFEVAKKLNKPCIYDMPIGYYPAWEQTQHDLVKTFADWLPPAGLTTRRFVRPKQKEREMAMADLVMVPSSFVRETVLQFTDKVCSVASYGVDSAFWAPGAPSAQTRPLRFLYVGHISVRKGAPILIEAWRKAEIAEAELLLVGSWDLADHVKRLLSSNVTHVPPRSPLELREYYQSSDVFVFPSFFEGFALVLGEAMACGLPVIASERTGGPDIVDENTGMIVSAGNIDAWVHALRLIAANREKIPQMKAAARAAAERQSWKSYRDAVVNATSRFV